MTASDVEVIDATLDSRYESYLYRCLAPAPFRKYRHRHEYLEATVPKGFRKKLLTFKGKVVGQIEYAPSEASGYPVMGNGVIVMNCIWVLRKAKGHRFGTWLMKEMMNIERDAIGFAAIGLEGHWTGWLRRDHMEKLGFRMIDSFRVSHKTKHTVEPFSIHLMWLPMRSDAVQPAWDKNKLLEGVTFCMGHPLYRPQTYSQKEILQEFKREGK